MFGSLFKSDKTDWYDANTQPPQLPSAGNGVSEFEFDDDHGRRNVLIDSSGNWREFAAAGDIATSVPFLPKAGARWRGKLPPPAPPPRVDVRTQWHCAVTTMPSEPEAQLYEYRRAVDGAIDYRSHSGSSWGRFAPEAGLEAVTFLEEPALPGDQWRGGKPIAVTPRSPELSEWFNAVQRSPECSGIYEYRDEPQSPIELLFYSVESRYWGRRCETTGELEVRATPLSATWRGRL